MNRALFHVRPCYCVRRWHLPGVSLPVNWQCWIDAHYNPGKSTLLRYLCENLYSISTEPLDGKIKILLAGQDWWTDFNG